MSGRKSVTISDVAKAARVSRASVSFVLNGRKEVSESTRQRVLEAIERLGYRPSAIARNLARRKAGAIGFVLPIHATLDPLASELLREVAAHALARQNRVLLLPQDLDVVADAVREKAIDAAILTDIEAGDPIEQLFIAEELPFATLWLTIGEDQLREGCRQLVQHLSVRGHNRVALIGGSALLESVQNIRRNLEPLLQDAGIQVVASHFGARSERDAMAAMTSVLEVQERPTAVLAFSDTLAVGLLHGARAHRLRVPEDIAITGVGDLPQAAWALPPLTTLRLPLAAMAGAAVARLLAPTTDPPAPPAPTLIVRRSC
jgi:DNA-binding LacI/PurR family transcriptional regulator